MFCRLAGVGQLIRRYSCCLHPGARVPSHNIRGAWVQSESSYKPYTLSKGPALQLRSIWWLELDAVFNVGP